jgi:hypothetical protein
VEGRRRGGPPPPGFLSRDPHPTPSPPCLVCQELVLGGGSSGSLVPCLFVSCLPCDNKDGERGKKARAIASFRMVWGGGVFSFLMIGDVATPSILGPLRRPEQTQPGQNTQNGAGSDGARL